MGVQEQARSSLSKYGINEKRGAGKVKVQNPADWWLIIVNGWRMMLQLMVVENGTEEKKAIRVLNGGFMVGMDRGIISSKATESGGLMIGNNLRLQLQTRYIRDC